MIEEPTPLSIDLTEGLGFSLSCRDDVGNLRDISSADVRLFIKGKPDQTYVPEADPQNSKGRYFFLTAAHAKALGNKPREYQVVLFPDDGGKPEKLLFGTMTPVGFAI